MPPNLPRFAFGAALVAVALSGVAAARAGRVTGELVVSLAACAAIYLDAACPPRAPAVNAPGGAA